MLPAYRPSNRESGFALLALLVPALITCDEVSFEPVPVATLEVTPGTGSVEIGQSLQLKATPKNASGSALYRTVAWNSSSVTVATVDGTGLVTGVSEGTATITATSESVSGAATIKVFEPGAHHCKVQSQIPEEECWALVALYDATNGPEWTVSTGWLANTTPCSWHGVTCATGAVVRLHLSEMQLTGSIPSELGNLESLQFLELGFNQLNGSIPPELGNLGNLQSLSLSLNQLTGSIPPELGNLGNLEYLGLFLNQLSGSIPPELGNLANLQDLGLYRNQLTGSIPPELGNLTNLEDLELFSNQLTGSIPPELGNLENLQSLVLHSNELSGVVPLTVAQKGGVIQSLYPTGWCTFVPPGNAGLFMPDTQDYRNADLDGDGLICRLGFTASW
jgi:hypothetical protein